ncbi:MAG TPA: hypothetical protein PKE47_10855 [Verrucomicrobiota bacterium]|nr:hypothetical protein [Verrucomicrobiota bacterium]
MAKRPRRRGRRTAAGRLLLGQFTEAAPEPGEPHRPLADIYAETLAGFRGPVLADVAYGHVPRKLTLPQGVRARVDGARGRVTLLEAAVA